MSASNSGSLESVTVTTEMNVGGGRMSLKMIVPPGLTHPMAMLPLFHRLSNTFVGVAEENVQKAGYTVSCQKGCGACCRQLVPISEIEARQIRNLVDDFPEPRRTEIRARFAAARERIEQAGLVELMGTPEHATREAIEALTRDYFRLGIACPFLEEESCSIHLERPAACREYLVVSPPEHCGEFAPEKIKRLEIPVRVSKALRRFNADEGKALNRWVPLILALDWADAHPDEATPRDGTEILRDFFEQLTGVVVEEAG